MLCCQNIFALICFMSIILMEYTTGSPSTTTSNSPTAPSSVINNNNNGTMGVSKENEELLRDMRWFFGGMETFCETMEDMLPKINATKQITTTMAAEEKRELTENNKLNFLMSLKYFFGSLKEVSRNIQQTFTAENIRQLEQLKGATDFIHEQLGYVRLLLGNFRAWITHLFRLYNYYVPEVLLGKCVSKYMRSAHPESAFYEYPLLMINDIFDYYLAVIEETNKDIELKDISSNENTTISMQQNEILNADEKNDITSANATNVESFFSLREYFQTDKNEIINNAAKSLSWHNCLKMYAVETVARQIKIFFLEM